MLSNCALSKPSETKTLATSSPDPPSIGSLWQPKQEFESGPLVRLNGGLTPLLRLVGMIACVAFGRPAPSTVVNFALNSSRPRSTRAGSADGPAAATASKSTCEPNTRSSQLPPEAALAARTADAARNAADNAGNRLAKSRSSSRSCGYCGSGAGLRRAAAGRMLPIGPSASLAKHSSSRTDPRPGRERVSRSSGGETQPLRLIATSLGPANRNLPNRRRARIGRAAA